MDKHLESRGEDQGRSSGDVEATVGRIGQP
jgi:hypothetical protein